MKQERNIVLGIVNYCLIQNDLNTITRTRNGGTAQ